VNWAGERASQPCIIYYYYCLSKQAYIAAWLPGYSGPIQGVLRQFEPAWLKVYSRAGEDEAAPWWPIGLALRKREIDGEWSHLVHIIPPLGLFV
jgi:hypothetical protein